MFVTPQSLAFLFTLEFLDMIKSEEIGAISFEFSFTLKSNQHDTKSLTSPAWIHALKWQQA